MTKMKPIEAIEKDKNGDLVFNLCTDEANSDPIRAARLLKKAKAGDKRALKKLKEMENNQMYRESDD